MLGTLFNTAAVALGSTIGLLCRKHITSANQTQILTIFGLFTIALSIDMMSKMASPIDVFIALIIGSVLGQTLSLHSRLSAFTSKLNMGTGFIKASVLFCVGAGAVALLTQAPGSSDQCFSQFCDFYKPSYRDGFNTCGGGQTAGWTAGRGRGHGSATGRLAGWPSYRLAGRTSGRAATAAAAATSGRPAGRMSGCPDACPSGRSADKNKKEFRIY